MSIESIIGILSGLIAIGTAAIALYKWIKRNQLAEISELMKRLANSKLSNNQHKKILRQIKRKLGGDLIKDDYINNFTLNNRGKEAIFEDICESNNIEPTEIICKMFLTYDKKKFRLDYNMKRNNSLSTKKDDSLLITPTQTISSMHSTEQTVFMSELLLSKYHETCNNLIKILEEHHVNYSFIKGTKDIWCRDYMPVQTESGKLIQFKYDPSYLKGKKEWEDSRSDVKEVCKLNNIDALFSDINLDGGNVLICDGRAILTDRIFSENPNYEKDALIDELSKLLECEEVIIIPAQKGDYTGHADGMVRFVNRNTIIGNCLTNEYKYWQKGMQKVLDTYNLTYIDIPFFEDNDPKHPDSAIGIYVNYLEVNDLIVVPIFNRETDKQSVEILQKTFPNKQIRTINYNEVAKEGGLLNCTTWVIRK